MAPAALTTRPRHRWHAPEKGSGPAFALSLFAHALLFLSIAFVVRWKSEPVGTVSAELWNLPPPAAVQQPAPVPAPPIPARVEPPPPEPPRKADIVEEKKAPKIEPKKELPPKKEELKKSDPHKKVEAKTEPVVKPPDPNAAIQRALAQAGKSPAAASGSGFSDRYAAQVITCIRPHIIFNVPDGVRPQQYVAEFEVMLLPTGEQGTDPKLLKASGLPPYDQAVERAIRRCNPFPPPKEGTMPRSVRLSFDPVETR
ncbi:MAG TPA: TonB C-terminal domain-containing protein [Burkholderiaceae bacterium]|jgi:colicin import membrane protein|nr:TonB C-terminal domain-containing protein [Burkholderiaceae bacterium]